MTRFQQTEHLYQKSIDKKFTPADIDQVISWPEQELSILFAATDAVRRHFFGMTVDPCAIMNVKSGGCPENCSFCAQSAHNRSQVSIQPLSDQESVVRCFNAAQKQELSFGVVSSGKGLPKTEIRKIAEAVRACGGGVHASLGILDEEDLRSLKDAGITCYHHNLETSRRFFPSMCTTHTYDDRIATVKLAKSVGLNICCGGIFGIGETWDDRKSLLLDIQSLNVNHIPINFLNPIAGTRVDAPKETPLEFLKIIAMFRLALPDKVIKAAGGREHHFGKIQALLFWAGANGYISGGYLTTGGDGVDSDDAMIAALGLRKSGQAEVANNND